MDLFDLTGKYAIITGGAGFLGRMHAEALAEAGANVLLWDFSEPRLATAVDELRRKFPGQIRGECVDVSDVSSVARASEAFLSTSKALHVLVNNAGMTVAQGEGKFTRYFDRFEEYPVEMWEMAIKVNLTGPFVVMQTLAPVLREAKHASVINIASDVGIISPDHRIYKRNPERDYPGVHFNSPLSYATSKAALIHMTKFLATYWASAGIRVNAISPAGVENSQDPKFQRELTDRIPLGRMALPHELKGAIVFLASHASSFVTGHNLVVDGGRTIW